VKAELSRKYKIKDLGELHWFLNIRVTRNRSANWIKLDQQQYVKSTLARFDMCDCKPIPTPYAMGVTLSKLEESVGDFPYREAVGALMYAMTSTRPDLGYVVGLLSRHVSGYDETHWRAVKRVFRYLRGTTDRGIVFHGTSSSLLDGFCDASYADNRESRRSTGGWYFRYYGGPVSWKSFVQRCVALSTCEAEYVALASATREAVWLRRLLRELGVDQSSVVIHEDNQGAIALASNAVVNQRSKHIDVRYHFVRDCVSAGLITLDYLPTEDMIADLFTKALAKLRFRLLCALLMGKDVAPIEH
jgi:hypothetical protein